MLSDLELNDLFEKTEPLCNDDTSDLFDWMKEGNSVGGCDGRTAQDIADEWNDLTKQAEDISNAARILGKLGGSKTSPRKKITSPANGKLGGRPRKYTVQHLGYPTTTRIEEGDWKSYSIHATESAAWKAVRKAKSHLQPGQWDDHYRVIAPDGQVCDGDLARAKLSYGLNSF
jgi:hypothetical protein